MALDSLAGPGSAAKFRGPSRVQFDLSLSAAVACKKLCSVWLTRPAGSFQDQSGELAVAVLITLVGVAAGCAAHSMSPRLVLHSHHQQTIFVKRAFLYAAILVARPQGHSQRVFTMANRDDALENLRVALQAALCSGLQGMDVAEASIGSQWGEGGEQVRDTKT